MCLRRCRQQQLHSQTQTLQTLLLLALAPLLLW
jgi:hypothetical protein